MEPVVINYLAVLACAVMSMVLGFTWYGPLFGKQYMRMQGMTEADVEQFKKDPAMRSNMMRNYALTFILALVMAFGLAHSLIFASAYLQVSGVYAGVMAGFWSWLSFVVPVTANLIFFDKKTWSWWLLVNGYYLIQLVLMGVILALWM